MKAKEELFAIIATIAVVLWITLLVLSIYFMLIGNIILGILMLIALVYYTIRSVMFMWY